MLSTDYFIYLSQEHSSRGTIIMPILPTETESSPSLICPNPQSWGRAGAWLTGPQSQTLHYSATASHESDGASLIMDPFIVIIL